MPEETAGELVLGAAIGVQVRQAGRPGAAQFGGDLPQAPQIGGSPGAGALLQPVEHLRHSPRGNAVQADLARSPDGEPDRLLGRLPGLLVE